MKKITVFEIVKEYREIGPLMVESVEQEPLDIPAFLREEDAMEFVGKTYNPLYPNYYHLGEQVHKNDCRITYRPKEIEIFECLAEYDEMVIQQKNKQTQEKIAKNKAEIAQLEDEME